MCRCCLQCDTARGIPWSGSVTSVHERKQIATNSAINNTTYRFITREQYFDRKYITVQPQLAMHSYSAKFKENCHVMT